MWFFDPTLLLFLLLPVAAFSGWVIGRRQYPQGNKSEREQIPLDYIKGLNFFLNEQPDKAVDHFIQMLEVNKETIETHLALGNLFRRRGEVDRAIRIHQNLVARPVINRDIREQALFELGMDYLHAGLLDRAETVFTELMDSNPHHKSGLLQLLGIYQKEREWDKAISVGKKLGDKTDNALRNRMAHFYCELAIEALQKNKFTETLKYLEQAERMDPACVRVSLIGGECCQRQGDYGAAIRYYLKIEQQDAVFLSEIIEQLVICFEKTNKGNEINELLHNFQLKHSSPFITVKVAEFIHRSQGEAAAEEFIEKAMQQQPTVLAMDKLIDLNLLHVNDTVKGKLEILKKVTGRLAKSTSPYKCIHCGFGSRNLYWQCPSCRTWESIKPLQDITERQNEF